MSEIANEVTSILLDIFGKNVFTQTFLLVLIVLALSYPYIKPFLEFWILERKSKAVKEQLIKSLTLDENIWECIDEHQKVMSPLSEFRKVALPILGLSLSFILSPIFQVYLAVSFGIGLIYSTLVINLILYFALLISVKKKNVEKLEGVKKTINRIHHIRSLAYGPILISASMYISANILYYYSQQLPMSEGDMMRLTFSLSIGLGTILSAYSITKDLEKIVKKLLNLKYQNKFPIIKVKTETDEAEGKIIDVFDKEMLKLKDNETMIPILWSSVKSLRIESNSTKLDDTKEKSD